MNYPLCFILMPFGQKLDAAGSVIDFDAVYHELIAPAIREAELEPVRADEEMTGGIIHKPMYERLILCEYAVADLTTANANVFYELGIRHAVRPWSTVSIFSEGSRLPFDVAPLRAMPYPLTAAGTPDKIEATKEMLVTRLVKARDRAADSPLFQLLDGIYEQDAPLFQLLEGMKGLDIARLKTDVFRDSVQYSIKIKEKLAAARKQGVEAIREVEKEMGKIHDQESGVVIDLFLSYRATKGWKDMIALYDKMSRPLAETVMVQEQYALALNRDKQSEKAEAIITDLMKRRGGSSETFGILGRIYKDRWQAALEQGRGFAARGLLDQAIDAYLRGFETDWRDAYPGVNACTLMTLREPPDPRRDKLLPIVSYAVERRIAVGKYDYWDYATLLELAVLAKDQEAAYTALGKALAIVREAFEPESTANNLRLIREARERRAQDIPDWMREIEAELKAAEDLQKA